MLDLRAIKETHARAEDSTKGAAEWFTDYAESAHEHRGLLIAEVERLRAALYDAREYVEHQVKKTGEVWAQDRLQKIDAALGANAELMQETK